MVDLKNFEGGSRVTRLPLSGGTEMLKKRDFADCYSLYESMTHPDVFPFVRHKVASYEEYVFATKQTMEAEENGTLVSRTIMDEWGTPIGTISLFDIENQAGFLGTWLGKPYHGKGYNTLAKEAFFKELFFELGIETVFMRIRKQNIRSIKAAEKLPYAMKANETRKYVYDALNKQEEIYDLYEISKDLYTLYLLRQDDEDTQHLLEA
jgi:RimJ/RimL family protein N-acetyltransferase